MSEWRQTIPRKKKIGTFGGATTNLAFAVEQIVKKVNASPIVIGNFHVHNRTFRTRKVA